MTVKLISQHGLLRSLHEEIAYTAKRAKEVRKDGAGRSGRSSEGRVTPTSESTREGTAKAVASLWDSKVPQSGQAIHS